MNRRTWTDEQLVEAIAASATIAGVARLLGLAPKGGTYKTIKTHAARLGLSTEHLIGQAWSGGLKLPPRPRIALDEILVVSSSYPSTKLRNRLLRDQIFEARCAGCGRDTWESSLIDGEQKIPLELDHINGVNTDNRLENLRLLCPNCHALTPTYRGKNKKL